MLRTDHLGHSVHIVYWKGLPPIALATKYGIAQPVVDLSYSLFQFFQFKNDTFYGLFIG